VPRAELRAAPAAQFLEPASRRLALRPVASLEPRARAGSVRQCPLDGELRPAAEMLERVRVCERIGILDRSPCTTLRTASSTILPLMVRGMSGTAMIFAGTWRGVVLARIVSLMRASGRRRARRRGAGARTNTTRTSLPPLLSDRERFQHLLELLDLAVDLGVPYARRPGSALRPSGRGSRVPRGRSARIVAVVQTFAKRSK